MSTSVSAAQMLVLTNVKSRQDAICRVVKVRTYSNSSSYVEVEFTHRQPGFWGVYFESDAIAAATPSGTADPSPEPSKGPSQTGSGVPAPRNTGLNRNESSFIGIGSQEDVQPAASSTSAVRTSSKVKPAVQDSQAFQKAGTSGVTQPSVSSISSASSQTHTTQEEEEDASLASEPLGVSSNDSDARAGRSLSSEAFGHRDSTTSPDTQPAEGQKNWLLVAACAAALLLAAGGALFFSHHKSTDGPVTQTQVPVSPVPNHAAEVAPPKAVITPTISRSNPAPALSAKTNTVAPARPSKDAVAATQSSIEPESSASTGSTKKAVPSVFGALNSHPVSSRQRTDGMAAPSLDASAVPNGDALAGIATALAPSAPQPNSNVKVTAPVQSGSVAREPKLLVRVIPQYPPLARQTHTEGDVVVQIEVDRTGSVTEAKATSGPTALRMAAIGAVKRWKYEPLEGQANSAKMSVTIQFRL